MKHISIILIFVVISIPSFGQLFVGKVDINESDTIKVIEVLITEKMSNKYVDVYVDFGQKSNFRAGSLDNDPSDQRITDPATGKPIRFKSTIDVIQFLKANTWDHYDSVVIPDKGERSFYYYFKRN